MTTMTPKTLLLISSHPDDDAFAKEVANTAGLTYKNVKTAKDASKILIEDESIVLFADASTDTLYQDLENTVQETVGLFSDKINSNFIHFIGPDEIEKAPYLMPSPLLSNYIIRNYTHLQEAAQRYGMIVKSTLNERAFGLTHILKPGTKVQTIKLNSSAQKPNAIEAVKQYLLAAKFQTRMSSVIANAVDELLMNAIFDAPANELGKQTLSTTPRSSVMKLEGQNSVEMRIGFDGTYVGISAVDLYGTLDKAKLISHISKIYVKEEYKIRTSVAGAGLGLATVFRAGASFFFVSENRVQTEAMIFYKRTESFREFKDQFRFLSTQFYF